MIIRLESKALKPLTNWRAKDRHDQQARIAARCYNHSLPGEPRSGMTSRLELQQGIKATHSLKPKTVMISRLDFDQGTKVTHFLESQRKA